MKKIMKINVLGTDYDVYVDIPSHDEKLKTVDGYIAPEKKFIVLDRNNVDVHQKKVLTHEIVHAFLYESGLDVESWANNEEIVDWIAMQVTKINKTSNESIRKLKPFYTKAKKKKEGVSNG